MIGINSHLAFVRRDTLSFQNNSVKCNSSFYLNKALMTRVLDWYVLSQGIDFPEYESSGRGYLFLIS